MFDDFVGKSVLPNYRDDVAALTQDQPQVGGTEKAELVTERVVRDGRTVLKVSLVYPGMEREAFVYLTVRQLTNFAGTLLMHLRQMWRIADTH